MDAKITALGDVNCLSLDQSDDVKAIRTAYEPLTLDQKELVSKLDILIAAECKISDLEAVIAIMQKRTGALNIVKNLVGTDVAVRIEDDKYIRGGKTYYVMSLTDENGEFDYRYCVDRESFKIYVWSSDGKFISYEQDLMKITIGNIKYGKDIAEKMCSRYYTLGYYSFFTDVTIINDKAYYNLNDILAAQYEAFETDGSNDRLRSNIIDVDACIKKLSKLEGNDQFQYNDIIDIYITYQELSDFALHHKGSLIDYSNTDQELTRLIKRYYAKYTME